MGALGDSFYEYLLKEWLRSGGADREALQLYRLALGNVTERLLSTSGQSGLTYLAEMHGQSAMHKMDHLACFIGGARVVSVRR